MSIAGRSVSTRKSFRIVFSGFSPGWDEERVRHVLAHYEQQTEDEAVAKIRQFTKINHNGNSDRTRPGRELIAKHEK